jgi:hypothetical protein
MKGDAIIEYMGQTIRASNIEITFPAFTIAQMEEADRSRKEMLARIFDEKARDFWIAHPHGGTTYYLPSGNIGFEDAMTKARSIWINPYGRYAKNYEHPDPQQYLA